MIAQDQSQRVQKPGLLLICGDRDIIRITSEYAMEAPRHCAKIFIKIAADHIRKIWTGGSALREYAIATA